MASCWILARLLAVLLALLDVLRYSYGSKHQHSYSCKRYRVHQSLQNVPPSGILASALLALRLLFGSRPQDLPPSVRPQGTLRYLINNTALFRAPDQLILRSRRLNMYLNLQTKWLVLRYLGDVPGSLRYILRPREGIGNS